MMTGIELLLFYVLGILLFGAGLFEGCGRAAENGGPDWCKGRWKGGIQARFSIGALDRIWGDC